MNFFGPEPAFYIGHVVYNAGGRFGPRHQRNLQLVWILQGEATVLVDGDPRFLGPKQATLLLPGHTEEFRFSPDNPTEHGWCEAISPQLEPALLELYAGLPRSLPISSRLLELARMGLSLRRNPRASARHLQQSLAQAIFHEFFHLAELLDKPAQPLPVPLERARAHIEQHFAQPCDLALLGKVAGVTPAHLIRLFRQHLELTPTQYLWRRRLEAARRLLVNSGLHVHEIASRTGFQSPYHFSRLARQYLGTTPRQYRQTAWNQQSPKQRDPESPAQARDSRGNRYSK